MAGAASKIDWARLVTKVHKTEIPALNRFKSQVDATATQTAALPSALPKINWDYYKKHASNTSIVSELEKNYTSIKIVAPKPDPSRIAEFEKNKNADVARFEKFKEHVQSYIDSAEKIQIKFKKMIPVKEMSMEEWGATFPEWSWRQEHPSLAPHYMLAAGLSREEAASLAQPDPVPYATKTAWKDWEKRKGAYKDE